MPPTRILLLEDEMLIALDMESSLSDRGHEVTVAASVAEAMEMLDRQTFTLAILDYHLRDGDSSRVASRARELDIPIVLCSGSTAMEQLAAVFGDVPMLSKPFSSDHLVALVDGLIDAQ